MKLKKIAALLAAAGPLVVAAPAFATNGMNMEGYGPVATGMGGASMAYDNGTAGLINNPATLGLMKSGTSRFDIAIGGLHPKVTASAAGAGSRDSAGDAYFMPAMGYVAREGNLTYGIGLMSQGGMGTEYGSNSFLSTAGRAIDFVGAIGGPGFVAINRPTGVANRSELGLGRVLLPLAYNISDSVTIGGTLDYVWGGLDMQAVIDGATFATMMGNATASTGSGCVQGNKNLVGAACGTMVTAMQGNIGPGLTNIGAFNWGQFDFSDGTNKMSQATKTTGWGGNIGMTWKASPALTLGAVYHAQTKLSDMTGNGRMLMNTTNGTGAFTGTTTMTGKYTIIGFQWPETIGIGLSYAASDKLQLVMDYKNIGWAKTMQNLHIAFTASDTGFAGTRMDAYLNQNWSDQSVIQLGLGYKLDEATTLRLGANISNSPIPSGAATGLVHPLFPAITTNHYTAGLGYAFDKYSSVDLSVSIAPSVSGTHQIGVNTSMSQQNWQAMFSQRF